MSEETSPEVVVQLVKQMSDSLMGVRWSSAFALMRIGENALPIIFDAIKTGKITQEEARPAIERIREQMQANRFSNGVVRHPVKKPERILARQAT